MKLHSKMPMLIIGFGSIGRRHYKNLLHFGYKNIAVFDPIDKAFEGFEKVNRIKNLNQNIAKNFLVAFICSPNNLHIRQALICAKAGCHLFIEKPLSHDLKNVGTLNRICQEKKLITLVGCNMRFHPCLGFIKKYLELGKLGKIYSIRHEFGYYLPYWRPNQDYRKNYAAKKGTGGGIILDDIHEFDLLFWLNDFGPVVDYKIIYNRASSLAIETEDQAVGTFLFKNKTLGVVICDYLDQNYSRNCKIVGEKGSLEWSFKENIVWLKEKDNTKKIFMVKNFDFNRVYLKEMEYFLNCVRKKQRTFNPINMASNLLKHCLK